ncbi:MAG: hypothetical protein ABSE63_13845 [Thermoguttaceae bacterium]
MKYHALALELVQEFKTTQIGMVTTDWVLAETGDGLARTAARVPFVKSVSSLFQSAKSRLIWIQEEILEESLTLYAKIDDKQWGLVDCASIVVMRHEEIASVLTADRHFQQAGFRCLLPTA